MKSGGAKFRVRITAQASQAVNATIDKLEQGGPATPAAAITFDYGFSSIYTLAAPIMAAAGMRGTEYMIPSAWGTTNYMTTAMVQALNDAAARRHCPWTTLSPRADGSSGSSR